MVPAHAYGRHHVPPPNDARQAAVALVLCRSGNQWRIPLTLRPDYLRDHAGQISLPGGSCEPGESTVECALREFGEELGEGLERHLRPLGTLTPLYVFGSRFLITPEVFQADGELEFRPNEAEVAKLLLPSVEQLLNPAHRKKTWLSRRGLRFQVPCWELEGHCIWGATAMILAEWTSLLTDQVGGD